MMNKPARYIRLEAGDELPALEGLQPFKAILVIEDEVSDFWQWDLARWLVASGCRILLAWGTACETWADAVEEASLESVNYEELPPDRVVITTSHEEEDLSEAFWFARHKAHHPAQELHETVILHISPVEKRDELLALYAQS
jgi:hypothetical protein